jgi:hypothetical protein
MEPVAEPDAMQQLARAVGRTGVAAQLRRYCTFSGGERGNELEALKTNRLFAAELRAWSS